MKPLAKLLAPASVAVIGASRKEGSLGKMFLDALVQMNFTGHIYPVNPNADKINGIPCFSDIAQLPDNTDLAVILLPKDFVVETAEILGKKGIRNIIVISAGFREIGGDGTKREEALKEVADRFDINLIGPNSMGLFNTDKKISLNATFSPTPPQPGHIGFISQSGALGVAVLELAVNRGLGFSVFVSTGNKAQLSEVEILSFLAEDENTRVIILYQESIDHPQEFRNICSQIVPHKPILTLKAGRTPAGLKAASSHTGALASDDVITDVFLKQCGILRCATLEELLDTALALSGQPLPPGNHFAVMTNAGGPGILASDALELAGIQLPELTPAARRRLAEILPGEAAVGNPVDMIASATHDTYKATCRILMEEEVIDGIFIIIVKPPVNTTPQQIAEQLVPLVQDYPKPVLVTLMAQRNQLAGLEAFHRAGIPVFSFPESAARATGNMLRIKQLEENVRSYKSFSSAAVKIKSSGRLQQAPFEDACQLLQNYGLPLAEFIITDTVETASDFFKNAGSIVLKVANEQIIHKSDEGFVCLNITTESRLHTEFELMKSRLANYLSPNTPPKILVQKMVRKGTELAIGAKRDPRFGPVIMFGLGGIFVEIMKDVSFRIVSFDKSQALEMIGEIKGVNLLKGFRNLEPVNMSVLADILLQCGRLMTEHPEIVEMDLNPLIWPDGASEPVVVDVRMTLQK